MISESDKEKIREISQKYRVQRILLFGSCLSEEKESHDIDLAVEGIAAKDFYSFYGELILSLSKPLDLIDLSVSSKFNRIVRDEGIVLYG